MQDYILQNHQRKGACCQLYGLVYYGPKLQHNFVYNTNNSILLARTLLFVINSSWQVELFFKWVKQYLQSNDFWKNKNSVRMQILAVNITHCLIDITDQSTVPEMRVFRAFYSLLCHKSRKSALFVQIISKKREAFHVFFVILHPILKVMNIWQLWTRSVTAYYVTDSPRRAKKN